MTTGSAQETDGGAALLSLTEVCAGYQSGIDILQGVSLTTRRGALTLVIGPNGAGKSTLLKSIFGLLPPHRGAVIFAGERIDGLSPHKIKRRGIGYMTQELNVFPLLTVAENVLMGGWQFRRDRVRLRRRVDWVYATFPVLAQRRRDRAGALSGGQARMLSLAREMIAEPALLLVDEPTAGLAPNLVPEIYQLLLAARDAVDATILLVDQNIEAAIPHADYVYMLNLGRVKAAGPRSAFGAAQVAELIRECLVG
jgi:ABC-type branched-subunit amino acid transport system ATPase component